MDNREIEDTDDIANDMVNTTIEGNYVADDIELDIQFKKRKKNKSVQPLFDPNFLLTIK